MSKEKYALKYTIDFDQDGFTKESCSEYQNVTDKMLVVIMNKNDRGGYSHEVKMYDPIKEYSYSYDLFNALLSIAVNCSLADDLPEWKKEICINIEEQFKNVKKDYESCK